MKLILVSGWFLMALGMTAVSGGAAAAATQSPGGGIEALARPWSPSGHVDAGLLSAILGKAVPLIATLSAGNGRLAGPLIATLSAGNGRLGGPLAWHPVAGDRGPDVWPGRLRLFDAAPGRPRVILSIQGYAGRGQYVEPIVIPLPATMPLAASSVLMLVGLFGWGRLRRSWSRLRSARSRQKNGVLAG